MDPLTAGVLALMGGFWLVCAWAAFWVIRLAVRYGVGDALQAHREAERAAGGSELTR